MNGRRIVALFASVLVSLPTAAQQHPYGATTRTSYVEHLTGEQARKHLENLRSRRPGMFEKAAADMRRRGFADTGRIEVFRTNRQASLRQLRRNAAFQLVQDHREYGSEGEVLLWHWDDGDYDTWEGTIYVWDYVGGTWITANSQMSVVENNEWYQHWVEFIDAYEPPPQAETPVARFDPAGHDPMTHFARWTESSGGPIHRVRVNWGSITQKWNAWAACTAAGCATAAIGCRSRNPAPWEKPDIAFCTAIMCAAAGIGCLEKLR